MLLQQIALCVQSSDKSYALIAAIGCSDKSPGVNASTFGGKLIRILLLQHVAQNQTSLILCNMLQRQNSVAATKFSIKFSCSHDEICCCDVLLRRVAAICRLVCSGLNNIDNTCIAYIYIHNYPKYVSICVTMRIN